MSLLKSMCYDGSFRKNAHLQMNNVQRIQRMVQRYSPVFPLPSSHVFCPQRGLGRPSTCGAAMLSLLVLSKSETCPLSKQRVAARINPCEVYLFDDVPYEKMESLE
jgi:hypothetical protein